MRLSLPQFPVRVRFITARFGGKTQGYKFVFS